MIGIYPGSFDPFTYGHLDIVRRAMTIVQRLHISVGYNPDKAGGMFDVNERKAIIEKVIDDSVSWVNKEFITVNSYDGLLIDHAKKIQAQVIFRGLRPVSDFEAEWNLQGINHEIDDGVETVMLFAHPKFHHTSSSALKQLVKFGHKVDTYAPSYVQDFIREKFNEPRQR